MRLELSSCRYGALLAVLSVACGDAGREGSSAATTSPSSGGPTGVGTDDTSGGSATTAVMSTGSPVTSTSSSSAVTSTSGVGTEGTSGGSSDTTEGGTSGGVLDGLCEPAGNLIAVGSLDGGMDGDAPVGWEVRTPGQPAVCAGSGPHVFASDPAPGCAGGAITVDANDVWDCYAVQTVSPYNSIEGGATYRIRATVRSQGNAVNPAAWFVLGVQWLDGNDGFFGDEKNPQPIDPADNDHDWKVLEWELVAPAQARRILVWMTAHYPGEVEYDHVAVIKK